MRIYERNCPCCCNLYGNSMDLHLFVVNYRVAQNNKYKPENFGTKLCFGASSFSNSGFIMLHLRGLLL
uniref:Uncharacterized protein n=1 Tax=Rhizophora mucronata TaxID=61149 RepID=A0A2P2P9J8_RHIMU